MFYYLPLKPKEVYVSCDIDYEKETFNMKKRFTDIIYKIFK